MAGVDELGPFHQASPSDEETSSDDSSSSDEGGAGLEITEVDLNKMMALEAEIAANPNLYDKHIEVSDQVISNRKHRRVSVFPGEGWGTGTQPFDSTSALILAWLFSASFSSQYVTLLRKCGLRERLREGHERMASLFPLSEQLWSDWVNDELAQVQGHEDVHRIQALFARAVQDYFSINIWVSYLE